MMTEELIKTYLNSLRLDFNLFKDSIKEVSDDIIAEGYSQYPIFIAHQAEVKLGEVILDREELQTNFTYQASILEDLVTKNIIKPNNVEKFKTAFKDPKKFCCIFLVTEYGAQFVFVPFEISEETPKE